MRIIHEKYKCIGCSMCVNICPSLFNMGLDGKAFLRDPDIKHDKGGEEEIKIIKDIACAGEAAEACPVQCIRIEKSQ